MGFRIRPDGTIEADDLESVLALQSHLRAGASAVQPAAASPAPGRSTTPLASGPAADRAPAIELDDEGPGVGGDQEPSRAEAPRSAEKRPLGEGGYVAMCERCGTRFYARRSDARHCQLRCKTSKAGDGLSARLREEHVLRAFAQAGVPMHWDELRAVCLLDCTDGAMYRMANKLVAERKLRALGHGVYAAAPSQGGLKAVSLKVTKNPALLEPVKKVVALPARRPLIETTFGKLAAERIVQVLSATDEQLSLSDLRERVLKLDPTLAPTTITGVMTFLHRSGLVVQTALPAKPGGGRRVTYSAAKSGPTQPASPSAPAAAQANEHAIAPAQQAPVAEEPAPAVCSKALLVGGVSHIMRSVQEKLRNSCGIQVIDWWDTSKPRDSQRPLPAGCQLVVVLTDMCSHSFIDRAAIRATQAGIPIVKSPHKWAALSQAVERQWKLPMLAEKARQQASSAARQNGVAQ